MPCHIGERHFGITPGYCNLSHRQPDDTHILGGLSDGTLSVRRRDAKSSEALRETQTRFDLPTILSDINIGHGPEDTPSKISCDTGEQRLQAQTSKKLKEHDKLLKNFKYSAALDSVLKKVDFFDIYFCFYDH